MSFVDQTNELPEELEKVIVEDANLREQITQLTKEEYENILGLEIKKYNHLKTAIAEERDLTERNFHKVLENWRGILSSMKSSELKRRLESNAEQFQKQLESKDLILQLLDQRIEKCFSAYEISLRANFISLDKFNALTNEKISALKKEFVSGLNFLRNEFCSEDESMMAFHNAQVI
jgi:hypothetical protein